MTRIKTTPNKIENIIYGILNGIVILYFLLINYEYFFNKVQPTNYSIFLEIFLLMIVLNRKKLTYK
jgi:hypothetical protein